MKRLRRVVRDRLVVHVVDAGLDPLPWMRDLDFQQCKAKSLLSEFTERVNIEPLLEDTEEDEF